MKIEIQGLDGLIKRFSGLSRKAEVATEKGRIRLAKMVQEQAKLNAPVGEGQLRNDIQVVDNENESIVTTGSNDHAIFPEFGTGHLGDPEVPHTTKDYWTYMTPDGKFITTHGMTPRPYMRPAAKFGENKAPEVFKNSFAEELRK